MYFNGIYGYVVKAGFISESEFKEENTRNAEIAEKEKINEAGKEKEIKPDAESRESDLIKRYGKTFGLKIFYGSIWIGMTKGMLLDSRGKPKEINRTVGSWGVHEQWIYSVYKQGIYKDTYFYLENDILTSYQE